MSNIPPIPQPIVGREEAFRYCEQLDISKMCLDMKTEDIGAREFILRSYCDRLIQLPCPHLVVLKQLSESAGTNHP